MRDMDWERGLGVGWIGLMNGYPMARQDRTIYGLMEDSDEFMNVILLRLCMRWVECDVHITLRLGSSTAGDRCWC